MNEGQGEKFVKGETRVELYIAKIKFKGQKHCIECPFRNSEDDCILNNTSSKCTTWEEQLEYCPLELVECRGTS